VLGLENIEGNIKDRDIANQDMDMDFDDVDDINS
jgi:hypothetical protein